MSATAQARIVRQATVTTGGTGATTTYGMPINLTMGTEVCLEAEVAAGNVGPNDMVCVLNLKTAGGTPVAAVAGREVRIFVDGPYGSSAGDGLATAGVPLVGSKNQSGHYAIRIPSSSGLGEYPTARDVEVVVKGGAGATGTKAVVGTFVVEGVRHARYASTTFAAPRSEEPPAEEPA